MHSGSVTVRLSLTVPEALLYVAVIVFLGVACYESFMMPISINPGDLGPGDVPLIVALFTLVLAIVSMIVDALKPDKPKVATSGSKRVIAGMLWFVIAAAIFPFAGIYPVFAIFILGLCRLAGAGWLGALMTSVMFLAFIYLAFDLLLAIPMN
ncbi:tripartite tricarboxylate transporter TctB family protein [Pseudomonas argentinensis]|uniref:tripartite tricarboxylate transporter TctB family protein n=1 Tax=Phytopseudomonas argentinensis TaxID=289370 RepID=UPI0009430231|nr:tripartite tricarboxylate transporter TctB family protein [Pseudomonas argentinensis]KAB0550117.1 tripartite tricarboxylate transporter TctB family protein [Pseudomonas argentinensis]